VDFDADELGADLDAIGATGTPDLDAPPEDEPLPKDDATPDAHA
jgi:hypothetical protein